VATREKAVGLRESVRARRSLTVAAAGSRVALIASFCAYILGAVPPSARPEEGAVFSPGRIELVTVYSQNEQYYLRSVPYDDRYPSRRGKTSVFRTGDTNPLYIFDRGFDMVERDSNNLVLSDDGETILYAIPWWADEETEGLKSVTIYRHGQILRSYTETDVHGCDLKRERCALLYRSQDEIIDKDASNWGTPACRKVYKPGVDAKERFLGDYAIFSSGDVVYLTDSKKQVHLFDLREGALVASEAFESLYDQIKDKGRLVRVELQPRKAPSSCCSFPDLADGRDTTEVLAELIGLKPASVFRTSDEQDRWYRCEVNANVLADGRLEIERFEADPRLPKERILGFLKTSTFDRTGIPAECDKWNTGDQSLIFRRSSEKLARKEKKEDEARERQELKRRLTAETVNGIYIPRDLGDCFLELDKMLSEVEKKEMRAQPSRDDMCLYHHGLGTWLRNNWGLWHGSRLQKYFTDRGVSHPDNMSGIILDHYHDWLNGRQDAWKAWEKAPKGE
jgi:hypothetical protein